MIFSSRFMGYVSMAAISIAAIQCNPAQRAIDQKRIIDEAIAKWVLENPVPMSELVVPGDTTILRDTSWLPYLVWDTIVERDTVRLIQIRYRTVKELVKTTDTLIRTVNNTSAIIQLQEQKSFLEGRLMASENTKKTLNLWAIILGVVVLFLSFLLLRKR